MFGFVLGQRNKESFSKNALEFLVHNIDEFVKTSP